MEEDEKVSTDRFFTSRCGVADKMQRRVRSFKNFHRFVIVMYIAASREHFPFASSRTTSV